MKPQTQLLLSRWKSLEEDGLGKARSLCRTLQIIGSVLAVFFGLALYFEFPVIIISLIALAVGWIIAERNALESRIKQWPDIKQYIDWQKVNQDLDREKPEA